MWFSYRSLENSLQYPRSVNFNIFMVPLQNYIHISLLITFIFEKYWPSFILIRNSLFYAVLPPKYLLTSYLCHASVMTVINVILKLSHSSSADLISSRVDCFYIFRKLCFIPLSFNFNALIFPFCSNIEFFIFITLLVIDILHPYLHLISFYVV